MQPLKNLYVSWRQLYSRSRTILQSSMFSTKFMNKKLIIDITGNSECFRLICLQLLININKVKVATESVQTQRA